MGRTLKFDRQEAIRWVMNEIWHIGYEACSVKYIADHLGITRSSFYHSFQSREALFAEVLTLYFQESPDNGLSEFIKVESPLKLLTQTFKLVCTVRANDELHRGCMVVNSVAELVGSDDNLGPIIKSAVQKSLNRFELLIEQSIKLKELPKNTDKKALALTIQNLLIGINAMSKVITNEQELWLTASTTLKALRIYKD